MENKNYPFLKLTLDEKFPRLLVTRRPENNLENQAIYGAFLPRGMIRRLIDLLERLFRLRPCELDIRGDFDAPCPEYFLHRCLAPCVSQICSHEVYLESIEIVHLILSNQFALALTKIDKKIERLAEDLEFEKAAEWRDKRAVIEEISTNPKWRIQVSAMNDVIAFSENNDLVFLHLSTLRRGKTVGRLDFGFDKNLGEEKILEKFIGEFYKFYAPKQIFIPFDFPDKKNLEKKLSDGFNRKIKIVHAPVETLPPTVKTTRKLAVHSISKRRENSDESTLADELKTLFNMRRKPRRVECFDVAHLAGREIVASRVIAVDGVLIKEQGLVWEFENLSEIASLASSVGERLRLLPDKKDLPDLILIDGGKAQISAVGKILREFDLKNISVIGAVKPPKAHNRIAYFLTSNNEKIAFDPKSRSHNFLQNLRDAAHDLANETHRRLHSLMQIFKNNDSAPRVQYLLVPTRFAERDGNAEDLSPIRSLTQSGEMILRKKTPPKASDF